jgi:hypothetical protein
MTLDEEYVRTAFAHELNSADHPVATQLLLNEIPRSFDNSTGFLKLIGGSISLGDARTKAGIIIPNVPMMTIDGNRTVRVMTKIARGIFYAWNHRPLPKLARVFVSNKIDVGQANNVSAMMDMWTRNTGWINLGDEQAFTMKMAMESPTSNHAIWLFVFYRSIIICAHTLPVGKAH